MCALAPGPWRGRLSPRLSHQRPSAVEPRVLSRLIGGVAVAHERREDMPSQVHGLRKAGSFSESKPFSLRFDDGGFSSLSSLNRMSAALALLLIGSAGVPDERVEKGGHIHTHPP